MNFIPSRRIRILTTIFILLLTVGVFAETYAQKKKRPIYYSVSANHVMRVRLNDTLDSEKARVGDSFAATLVDPLYSKGGVLLAPQGSTISGRVTNVLRAQKNGKPATLDVVFTSIRLPNSTNRAINGSLTALESSTGTSDNRVRLPHIRQVTEKQSLLAGALSLIALVPRTSTTHSGEVEVETKELEPGQ